VTRKRRVWIVNPYGPLPNDGWRSTRTVLLARTLLSVPRVMIADEPTRGVDVGAKRAIYDFIASLAADGLGVILISSELEEILGLSHRVLVMRRGRVVAELAGDAMTESAILAAAFADEPSGGVAA